MTEYFIEVRCFFFAVFLTLNIVSTMKNDSIVVTRKKLHCFHGKVLAFGDTHVVFVLSIVLLFNVCRRYNIHAIVNIIYH